MHNRSWTYAAAALLLTVTAALTPACEGGSAESEAPAALPFTPTATIKDLMLGLVDTNADVVWLAVTAVHTEQGVEETKPQNEEEWNKVRLGAVALAEASNLLLIPGRRVARPGEKSEAPGVELEPEEMDKLIADNRNEWTRRAVALNEAATAALRAIDARDPEKLFELGEQIELACEGCHTEFWYPNEEIPPVEINIK